MNKTTFKEYSLDKTDIYEYILQKMESQQRQYGMDLEKRFECLCIQSEYKLTPSTTKEDLLLGYDYKLSWTFGGKDYSVMIDVTARDKDNVHYYTDSGELKRNYKAVYGGDNIQAHIGLKTQHYTFFKYKTPVYVIHLTSMPTKFLDYQREFEHIISSLMRTHMVLAQYKRASQVIYTI